MHLISQHCPDLPADAQKFALNKVFPWFRLFVYILVLSNVLQSSTWLKFVNIFSINFLIKVGVLQLQPKNKIPDTEFFAACNWICKIFNQSF